MDEPRQPWSSGSRSILVFTEWPWIAAQWWARMFEVESISRTPKTAAIRLGSTEIGFCLPDSRNARGGSPAAYMWINRDFNAMRRRLTAWSCMELHYPIVNPDGTQMTQFEDPFGNIFGIQADVGPEDEVWPEALVIDGTEMLGANS